MSLKLVFTVDDLTAEDAGYRLLVLGNLLVQAKYRSIAEEENAIVVPETFKPQPLMAYVEHETYYDDGEIENWGAVNIDIENGKTEDEKYYIMFSRGFLAWASRNETFNELMELRFKETDNDETETDNPA